MKLSKMTLATLIFTAFSINIFANNLPYRDIEKDKARFGVNDIVYAEEIILNQCNITPSIELANRIKNGALVYPFLPEEAGGKYMKFTLDYYNKLDDNYKAYLLNRNIYPMFPGFVKYTTDFHPEDIKKADADYFENYKDYQEKLKNLIDEGKTKKFKDRSFRDLSLMRNRRDAFDILFSRKIFKKSIYGILDHNLILFYELFGYSDAVTLYFLDRDKLMSKASRDIYNLKANLYDACNRESFEAILLYTNKYKK